MSHLTRVRPTVSFAKITLSEGEKHIFEEENAVIECPNLNTLDILPEKTIVLCSHIL